MNNLYKNFKIENKLNSSLLNEKFKSKDYSYCIYILDEQIKSILINKIKKINNNFSYTTLSNLKDNCVQYLDYNTKLLAIEFYNLSIIKENELVELNKLLNIIKELST